MQPPLAGQSLLVIGGDLDVAAACFRSNSARFPTGQMLAVDGGWSVSEGQHE